MLKLSAIFFLAATAAMAQSSSSTSTSESDSVAIAGASVVLVQNSTSPDAISVTGMGMASAPSMATGNICALGVSAGASFLGGGFAVGSNYTDQDCVLISQAAALNSIAGRQAAIIHLATNNIAMCKSLAAAGAVISTCGEVSDPVASAVRTVVAQEQPTCIFTRGRLTGVQGVVGMTREQSVAYCRRK